MRQLRLNYVPAFKLATPLPFPPLEMVYNVPIQTTPPMTDQHPITPPPELVEQWLDEWMTNVLHGTAPQYIAAQAARWGADQELEACCEWLLRDGWAPSINRLRAARRPKPKSLAEEGLQEINAAECSMDSANLGYDFTAVRRALKRLQELEGQADG